MRHIAIIIIAGTLFQACSENHSKQVSNKIIAPTTTAQKNAAVVPANTTAKKQVALKSDKVSSARAAPTIPAEKKALRAMTFNEAQFSDDASDYPSTPEAKKLEKEKYNQ